MGAILLVSGLFYFRSKLLRSACFSSFSVFFFLFSQSILLVPLLFDPKFAFFCVLLPFGSLSFAFRGDSGGWAVTIEFMEEFTEAEGARGGGRRERRFWDGRREGEKNGKGEFL